MTDVPRRRLAIADDHVLVADGLAAVIREWAEVVGTATELNAVHDLVRNKRPDVLVLDLFFGRRPAFSLIEELVVEFPRVRIVVLTAHEDPVLAEHALKSGASSYVVKRGNVGELRIATDEAMAGRHYISPEMRTRAGGDERGSRKDGGGPFTERQQEVLGLLHKGMSSKEIGLMLGISPKTVDRHIDDMCKAIGVGRRARLLHWTETAMRNGVW